MGLALTGVLLALLAAGAVSRGFRAQWPRCYWLAPPLVQYERLLLNRGFMDCAFQECRLTLHQTADTGWVCFFARPWGRRVDQLGAPGA